MKKLIMLCVLLLSMGLMLKPVALAQGAKGDLPPPISGSILQPPNQSPAIPVITLDDPFFGIGYTSLYVAKDGDWYFSPPSFGEAYPKLYPGDFVVIDDPAHWHIERPFISILLPYVPIEGLRIMFPPF